MLKAMLQTLSVLVSSLVIAGFLMHFNGHLPGPRAQSSELDLSSFDSTEGYYQAVSSPRRSETESLIEKGKNFLKPRSARSAGRRGRKEYLKLAGPSPDPFPQLAEVFEKAASKILDSVVSISVTIKAGEHGRSPGPFPFPFGGLDDFFGFAPPRREISGGGSGFLINKDEQYVLTNCHVVDPRTAQSSRYQNFSLEELNSERLEITVTTRDERVYLGGPVIGASPDFDMAVIKVPNIETNAQVKESHFSTEKLKLGMPVLAAGSPFGLHSTVTYGIVSSVHRSNLGQGNTSQVSLTDYFQTDAAINPGNSGGPVVDLRGHVVGMSTALIGPNSANVGIGLAIPTEQIREVVPTLIEDGTYRRGSLGVNVTDLEMLDEEVRKANGISPELTGVLVHSVVRGSSAEKAGIQGGDILYKWNGKPLKGAQDLIKNVALSLNKEVEISVLRDHRRLKVKALIQEGSFPSGGGSLGSGERGTSLDRRSKLRELGLSRVKVLNKEEARALGVAEGHGLKVLELSREGSLFKRLDIRPGDVIAKVNRVKISRIRDLEEALQKEQNTQYLFTIYRDGAKLTVLYSNR